MSHRRRLLSVPVSLALHALVLFVLVIALREREEPPLFVDLTHGWVAGGGASGGGGDVPAPASTPAPGRGAPASPAGAASPPPHPAPARGARVRVSEPQPSPSAASPPVDVASPVFPPAALADAPAPPTAPAAPRRPPAPEPSATPVPPVGTPSAPAAASAPPAVSAPSTAPVPAASAEASAAAPSAASGVGAADADVTGRSVFADGGLSLFPATGDGGRGAGRGAGGAGTEGRRGVARDGGAGAGDGLQARAAPGEGPGEGTDYAPYLALLRQRIQESLRYPAAARRRGLTGTVSVEIEVAASGAIARAAVVRSSSHPILDEAALDAVRALPRVPFPAALRPRALRARLPVIFDLR